MKRINMEETNKEINCTGYARNKVKSMGNEMAEIVARMEFASNLVSEGILDVELYKNFVERQKVEIKDILAETYSYFHLEDVPGRHDHVFK
ncbi:hypothetical protein ACH6EH_06860 [Paenibacillus sp. JSM ZJ436]|uniref:hypothetical protein n=1 Tax=Paenibacillus sp. JSM ZJ436 TaxID=3376190 RepID=UPI0037A862B3